ncbi:MAG: hypothetical protein V3T86_03875 [Planctomycetota bacterium]
MILFLAGGFALRDYVDFPTAAMVGVLVALAVPDRKSSCAIKTNPPATTNDASGVCSVPRKD